MSATVSCLTSEVLAVFRLHGLQGDLCSAAAGTLLAACAKYSLVTALQGDGVFRELWTSVVITGTFQHSLCAESYSALYVHAPYIVHTLSMVQL